MFFFGTSQTLNKFKNIFLTYNDHEIEIVDELKYWALYLIHINMEF